MVRWRTNAVLDIRTRYGVPPPLHPSTMRSLYQGLQRQRDLQGPWTSESGKFTAREPDGSGSAP